MTVRGRHASIVHSVSKRGPCPTPSPILIGSCTVFGSAPFARTMDENRDDRGILYLLFPSIDQVNSRVLPGRVFARVRTSYRR